MDTGQPLETVRDRLTQANVYIGCEGIVEVERGADIVICGRVTDVALYLGPMRYALGAGAPRTRQLLGAATGVAHLAECGGQATGGLFSAGGQETDRLERLGYPVTTVYANGEAEISKSAAGPAAR